MNTDKAYLLGLVVGGGVFGNAEDVFFISLPYKKWGSYLENPQRAGRIAEDILRRVGQMFRTVYGLSVQYETVSNGNVWRILCEGDTTELEEDLNGYGIECEGELRGTADIGGITASLIDDNLKRRFVAGLADTIGSMARSHRRFSDEYQTISFEIKGYNFKFVCDLCRLLYSINCIPDQIIWNHPNIHCTSDPYYLQWNKGFKLRVLLDQYAQFGAFAFRTKAETSNENRRLQQNTHEEERCETRDIHFQPTCVHPAENDQRLPEEIRGGHYINFRHFCAVMRCEHAPYCKITEQFAHLGELVIPFPILHKGEYDEVQRIVEGEPLMSDREYESVAVSVDSLLHIYGDDSNALLYGDSDDNGYPVVTVLQAVAYILAEDHELAGKRPRGGYIQVVESHLSNDPALCVEIRRPDILTPLVIFGNGRGALIGARNPDVYGRLVTMSPENEYKLLVRRITEEDLRNDEQTGPQ